MAVPVGVIAALVMTCVLLAKALRRFPVTQQIALDQTGVRMDVDGRVSQRPWSAFSGSEALAGCVLLQGERGDVQLLAHRLAVEQRAGIEAWLAQGLPRQAIAPAPTAARAP